MPTTLRLLLAFAFAAATPLRAQDATPLSTDSTAEDSVAWQEGRRAGQESGERPSVAGRAALGFIGGAPTGFFLLPAATISPPWMLVAGSGTVLVLSAARAGDAEPPEDVVGRLADNREAFTQGFRQGHKERLRARRRRAAIVGGTIGTAAGFGSFVWMLSHMAT